MNDTNSNVVDLAQNLVERVIAELTFHHDQIKVWPEKMGRLQILYLQVHRGDMPRIIGKSGAHRHALFNLIEQIGLRHSTEIRLEYVEPEAGEMERFAPFSAAARWDSRPIIQLMRDILATVFLYETEVTLTDSAHAPTSTIQVVVSDQEHMQTVVRVTESLKVLFNAIGKRHGRILLVDVISQRVQKSQLKS